MKWKRRGKKLFKRENIEAKMMKNEMKRLWSWTFAFGLANAFIKLGLVRYLSCFSSIRCATCLQSAYYCRYYTTMSNACDDFRGWRLTPFRYGSSPSSVLHPYVTECETDKSLSLLDFYGYFDIYNCIDTVGCGWLFRPHFNADFIISFGHFFCLFYHRTIASIKTK